MYSMKSSDIVFIFYYSYYPLLYIPCAKYTQLYHTVKKDGISHRNNPQHPHDQPQHAGANQHFDDAYFPARRQYGKDEDNHAPDGDIGKMRRYGFRIPDGQPDTLW